MKAPWFWEKILGKNLFNIFANTFLINLYKTLHKLIGLYLENLEGFFTFGMRAIKVKLMGVPKKPIFNKLSTA
jgi:hypothetical protein